MLRAQSGHLRAGSYYQCSIFMIGVARIFREFLPTLLGNGYYGAGAGCHSKPAAQSVAMSNVMGIVGTVRDIIRRVRRQ